MGLSVADLAIKSPQQDLVSGLSFTVPNGRILSIMGPSGCGKSTLLSAIAGHIGQDFAVSGSVYLNDQPILELAPEKRKIGILFQDDLLFPHLNIWQNLAFGLPESMTATQKKNAALDALDSIGLLDLAEMSPPQISGGQRARISLLRTLLSEPHAILLDEPFSKLDKPLRRAFREFVFEQITDRNIPALMVTHDSDDVPDHDYCLNWPSNAES